MRDITMRFRRWIAQYIILYRPERLQYVVRQPEFQIAGRRFPVGLMPCYELGPLRAKVFGIRVPTLWAIDNLIFAGILQPAGSK